MVLNRRFLLECSACAIAGMALGADASKSMKKGFGIALNSNPDWKERLTKLNANWFYTWGPHQPSNLPSDIEFVPMIWGRWNSTPEVIRQLDSRKHKSLLGFNEPDGSEQARIPVEEALRLWPILMESGMRLGSPACVNPEGEWMAAFMKEAVKRNYRIDFIAVHSYLGVNSQYLLNTLERVHRLYNKPIWVTEFAVADWDVGKGMPNRYAPDDVLKLMETVLPALEQRDYIERYAWFDEPNPRPALETSRLFNPDGSLTRLGQLYASF